MRSKECWWLPLCATVFACNGPSPDWNDGSAATTGDSQDRAPDERPAVRAAVPPPPISGGTLVMVGDTDYAVASDPDRDRVYVVDLSYAGHKHTIELEPGDEPGRLTVDADGNVHVATRRGGAVVAIDPNHGEILGRRSVCPNPRGIVYDEQADALHVACAGGELVTMPASGGEPTRRLELGPDLRDVVMTPEGLVATRFRSARVLRVGDDGTIIEEQSLPTIHEPEGVPETKSPSVAWRTVATPDGEWLMVHQLSSNRTLPDGGPPDDSDDDDDTIATDDGSPPPDNGPAADGGGGGEDDGGGGGGGGGGGYGAPDPCGGAVNSAITVGSSSYVTRTSGPLADTVLAVDVAISPSGKQFAIAIAGREDDGEGLDGVMVLGSDSLTDSLRPNCEDHDRIPIGSGQLTALTFDWQGRLVVQSREPAQIVRYDLHTGVRLAVDLQQSSVDDTGHTLFHRDAGDGISCASCHPEGGDDGRVWQFASLGPRHTPALNVGLEGTEPFHWQGDLEDIDTLFNEVHHDRMGGRLQSDDRRDALKSWMFALPIPNPERRPVDVAVIRGAAAFSDWGCAECHSGPSLDGRTKTAALGTDIDLQIPPLRGVALHPPYMHDGSVPDLRTAVTDMVERTQPSRGLPSDEEVADIVAYLESL